MNLTTKLARKNMKICSSGNNWMGNAEAVHGQESFLRRSSAATMNMVELTKRKGRSYQFVFRNTNMACYGTRWYLAMYKEDEICKRGGI